MWGFISAGIGAISGAISAVGSALGSAAGTLGGLATGALNALKTAMPFLEPIMKIISSIAQMLGVFNKEDDMDELGAKAMQPEAKKSEEFKTYSEYIDHLRNDIKLDREKFDKAGEVEQLTRKSVGIGIAMRGINEEKGFNVPFETYVAMGKLGLGDKAKEVDMLIETFKDGKLGDFVKYVDGKLEGIEKNEQISDALTDAYKELEPEKSVEEIADKVMKAQVGDTPEVQK